MFLPLPSTSFQKKGLRSSKLCAPLAAKKLQFPKNLINMSDYVDIVTKILVTLMVYIYTYIQK